jgi:hypothetical protein
MSFANKVNRQLQAASKRQDEVEAKVDSNIRVTQQNTQEIEKLREELSKMQSALESEREARNDMLGEELRDREARRNNLIIHGLQEVDIPNPRDRMERDRALCGEILSVIGARTRATDLRFCRRVGERGREARPLVIGVRSEEEKRNILDRAAELRRSSFSNISIGPDMTRMQRRAEDQLAREVETRNNQLTAEDREKNLRWMVVGRRGEKRMIKGTEREQQNYGRREAQLGDYIQGSMRVMEQRDYRNEIQTGARRREYQQQPTIPGPQLLAPRYTNSANYTPIQHGQQQQRNTSWQQPQYRQAQPATASYNNNNAPRPNTAGQANYGGGGGFGTGLRQQNFTNSGNISNIGTPAPVNSFRYTDNANSNNGYEENGRYANNTSGGYQEMAGNGYRNNGNSGPNNNTTVMHNNSMHNNSGPANIQLTWRGNGQNDSGYTEPNWHEQRRDGDGGNWQGNTQQGIPARQDSPAAEAYGTMDGTRPRLNSKRGRDGLDQTMEEGPPRTRSKQ